MKDKALALYRAEFPLGEGLIYLNHAAVAPWPRRTAEAVTRFAEENCREGARYYKRWLGCEHRLREQLRVLLNAASADDIALLKNTSEALSLVAYGLDWRQGDNIVTSNEEFPSNRIVWESLAQQGVALRQADLASGPTPEDALLALVDARTRLLTISSVQYASGRRLDLERLGKECRARQVLFCIDAIQSLGALSFDVQGCQADFIMADGHKWLLGPEGVAVFYCRPELRDQLRLHEYGWHMVEHQGDYDRREWRVATSARRFECGSPNMLGIHALSASLSLLLEIGIETIEQQVLENSAFLLYHIARDPQLELLTPAEPGRYAGIVTFRHRQLPSDRLLTFLMENGVICAARGGGVRFSPHFYLSTAQLERALLVVRDAAQQGTG